MVKNVYKPKTDSFLTVDIKTVANIKTAKYFWKVIKGLFM